MAASSLGYYFKLNYNHIGLGETLICFHINVHLAISQRAMKSVQPPAVYANGSRGGEPV